MNYEENVQKKKREGGGILNILLPDNILAILAFSRNNSFFLSLDHLTVTEPVAILKADEVWGALRGKLMLSIRSCFCSKLIQTA